MPAFSPAYAACVAATQRPHASRAAPLPASHARLSTRQAASAVNQPLSFNTSSVTNMSSMFHGASAFNQPLSFDTSKVTTMSYMFYVRSARALAPSLQLVPLRARRLRRRRSTPSRLLARTHLALHRMPSLRLGRARRHSISR